MPEPKPPQEEDELDELPAIDGDEDGNGDETDASSDDLDETPDDAGDADPFDDSTGEGDPLEEVEVSGEESGWLDDAGDSETLDVGTPEAFGAEEESSTLLEGAEETDDPDMDDELSGGGGEGEERSLVGDAGEEGFEEEEEEVREEELPRLDADHDDAEIDDPDLLDTLPDEEVTEEPRPPWDDRAWERVEGGPPGLAAIDALIGTPEGLLVAGQGLARIDRAGGVTALEARGLRGGAPQGLALDGDWIAVSTTRAGVLVSKDGGKSFSEANGWRAVVEPGAATEGSLDLVFVAGDLWGRAGSGALVWSGDRGVTWARVLPDRRFEAIAGDMVSGEVIALTREADATVLGRGAAGRVVLASQPDDSSGRGDALPAGKILALVAQGPHVSVALARGAYRADRGGWARLDGTAGLTAMTFARDDGTLLIALHSEGEGRAWLLQARLEAPAFTVAELGDNGTSLAGGAKEYGEDGDDSRVRALCWDEAAGVVWAAGGFGLIALRPARR